MKNNKLFLVCPFSQMEPYITNNIDKNAYFITGITGRLCLSNDDYLCQLQMLLFNKNIRELIVVNDVNCIFINEVLSNNSIYKTAATKLLESLFLENRELFLAQASIGKSKHLLAKLNVIDTYLKIINNNFLKETFSDLEIEVSGLISNKLTKSIKKVPFIYEY